MQKIYSGFFFLSVPIQEEHEFQIVFERNREFHRNSHGNINFFCSYFNMKWPRNIYEYLFPKQNGVIVSLMVFEHFSFIPMENLRDEALDGHTRWPIKHEINGKISNRNLSTGSGESLVL